MYYTITCFNYQWRKNMNKTTLSMVPVQALNGLVFEDVGSTDLHNNTGTDAVSYIFKKRGER